MNKPPNRSYESIVQRRAYAKEYQRKLRLEDPEAFKAKQRERYARKKATDPDFCKKQAAANKAWRKGNAEHSRKYHTEYSRKWRAKLKGEYHPGYQYPEACQVCGNTAEKICFDHCHRSGKFRGWLCSSCNLSLGRLKDNPSTLRALATYLDNFNQNIAI